MSVFKRLGPPLALMAVLLVAHLRAVSQAALVVYGHRGAEYLEHIQREHALHLTEGLGLCEQLWASPRLLSLLDGEYPAGLHLLAALWARLAGSGMAASVNLNLVFVCLIAAGVAGLTHALRGDDDSPDYASPVAAMLVLASPGVFATARRYYYDLPLTALVVLASFALAVAVRRRWALLPAALLSGMALLVKWQAGLYLLPVWLWALAIGLRAAVEARSASAAIRWLVPWAAAGLLAGACCWPLLSKPLLALPAAAPLEQGASSLLAALGQRQGPAAQGLTLAEIFNRLEFYARGAALSLWGPLALLALVVGLRPWRVSGRRAAPWALAGLGLLAPLAVLCTQVRVLDERFLLPLLPGVTAALCAVGAWSHRGMVLVCLVALTQWAVVDLTTLPLVQPPVAQRGWSRPSQASASPFQVFDEVAKRACGGMEGQREVLIDAQLLDPWVHGWRWGLARHCPGWSVGAARHGASQSDAQVLAAEPEAAGFAQGTSPDAQGHLWVRRAAPNPSSADEQGRLDEPAPAASGLSRPSSRPRP